MSIQNTVLNSIQANYNPGLDRDELRSLQFGFVDCAMKSNASGNSIITPEVRNLLNQNWKSADLQLPVMTRGTSFTVSDGRSCSFTDGTVDSAFLVPVYITKTVGFHMLESANSDNIISYQNELALKLLKAEESLTGEVDTAIYNALNTNKSAVYGSPVVGAGLEYTLAGDALQVGTGKREDFFNEYPAIASEDNFTGPYDVIGTPFLQAYINKFVNQGAGNDTNLSYQFMDYSFMYANTMPTTAGSRATGFIMPAGTIALESRLSFAEANEQKSTKDGIEFGSMISRLMPGMQLGYKYQTSCGDHSPTGGTGLSTIEGDVAVKENWTITADFCVLLPYNSNGATLAGSIHKFDILA